MEGIGRNTISTVWLSRPRDAGPKCCHHSQTSPVQSNPFTHGTCCWLGWTIPLLFPSNSSILRYLSLTCTRVRGSHQQTVPWRSLTVYFKESIKDKDVKFWQNLVLSLQFGLFKFGINIFDGFETAVFGNVSISKIFSRFSHHKFWLNGKF